MAKTKTTKAKKIIEKELAVPEVKPEIKTKIGDYKVFIKVNGIVTEGSTDDVASFIMNAKPELPKTTLTIRVTKGKVVRDRFLQLQEAKRLYNNEITMIMFIKNLLF